MVFMYRDPESREPNTAGTADWTHEDAADAAMERLHKMVGAVRFDYENRRWAAMEDGLDEIQSCATALLEHCRNMMEEEG